MCVKGVCVCVLRIIIAYMKAIDSSITATRVHKRTDLMLKLSNSDQKVVAAFSLL